MTVLYPFKFDPILKPVLWGGEDICSFKNISAQEGIGESWELSGVDGRVSTVSNGILKGKSLSDLIATAGKELLGRSVIERFGTTFPLLIKFIDAKQALSIQVHPNDALAQERHQASGKTEMWYVIKASPRAFLYSGFKETMNAETYEQSLREDTLVHCLQKYEVRAGDAFFLPAGRVHAIGAGCFIAEIQQTSDITYRIYDYNRKDANGQTRELHTELSHAAIDFHPQPDSKVDYHPGAEQRQSLVRCPYFTTNVIEGKAGDTLSIHHTQDSFVILICLRGLVTITDSRANSILLKQGETTLLPAANLRPLLLEFSGDSRLLETYIE
jgi:mannose-6-phosphate isomerase